MSKIYIARDIFMNKEIDGYALLLMMGLNYSRTNNDLMYVNTDGLYYTMSGKIDIIKYTKNKIFLAFNELIKNKYIEVVNVINKNEYIIKTNSFEIDTSNTRFTYLYLDEIRKIINLDQVGIPLLKYYTTLISHINRDTKCWCMSVDELRTETGVSMNTALNYNDVLEKNELLYVHRIKKALYDTDDDTIKSIVNTYGRYKDRGVIELYANSKFNKVASMRNIDIRFPEEPNGRSIKQRYNKYVDGLQKGNTYTDEFVSELRDSCKLYNEWVSLTGRDWLKKIDMDIFINK